ncbi:MAG: hypothetical protein CL912_27550 [Deltaproteobacteria bacterium]|nr:hypothetical protein [Deltaproteobacteria bacterium]
MRTGTIVSMPALARSRLQASYQPRFWLNHRLRSLADAPPTRSADSSNYAGVGNRQTKSA